MSPWGKLLEKPHSRDHFVQLYDGDEASLSENVSRYLWEGLRRGEGALLVASREHQMLFSRCLHRFGADLATLLETRQLVCWDAQQTLSRFMSDGQPAWRLFEKVICAAIRKVRPANGVEGLRAYGEMVGILWKSRQFAAAMRLEQLWNKLLEQSSFSLYCSYGIDVFGEECELANFENVLCAHTHLIPTDSDGRLEAAIQRALDEVLGPRAGELRIRIKANYRASWTVVPSAENMVLWLRKNLPEQADRIVSLARRYYSQRPQAASGD